MFRELLSIFRSGDPLGRTAANFSRMLKIANELTVKAGNIYFSDLAAPDELTEVYKRDVKVNKLERKIRKQVIAHLSVHGTSADLPHALVLMSLVKDAERIGDYAKNLAETLDVAGVTLPDDDVVSELREIRAGVESAFTTAGEVFARSDQEEAVDLIRQGRDITHRCDALISRVARSDYNAATTTAVVLGTRFYKRIGAHLLNILSSVVMPLHKLDYYDEKLLDRAKDRS